MENDVQAQVEERLAQLPSNVREAIVDSGFEEKVRTIGQKQNLHVDQIGLLGDETTLVMLGFVKPDAFQGQLVEQLRLSPQQAQAIAGEINTTILLPIRESL